MHTPPAKGWDLDSLKEHFRIDEIACNLPDDAAAHPGSEILAVAAYRGRNYLVAFHWGLVPPWAQDTSRAPGLINARSETLSEKPSFREAFQKRRCLIVAQGFIEWQADRQLKKVKKPVFLTLPGKKPMGFAGLWEKWSPPATDAPLYRSCTIVTVQASEHVRPYHHRMPAVLRPDQYSRWLDNSFRDTTALSEIFNSGVQTEFDVADPPEAALSGSMGHGA